MQISVSHNTAADQFISETKTNNGFLFCQPISLPQKPKPIVFFFFVYSEKIKPTSTQLLPID
jgi:hypothetical protein